MNTAWIRHPQTEAVLEVPASAVPIYRQSNWVPLTEQEVADLHQTRQQQMRSVEAAMEQAARPTPAQPPQPTSRPEPEPSRRKSGSNSKENS